MVPTGELYSFQGHAPQIDATAFVAPGSQIIGRVKLAAHSHVLFNCVLRGDSSYIEVGEGTNIQDNSTIHLDPAVPLLGRPEWPCIIGRNVTIGHNCLVHGCVVEDECLIGMGAIVMSGAVIGTGSIIGAGALVTENTRIPPYSMVLGQPGKVRKTYAPEEVLPMIRGTAENYRQRAVAFRESLRRVPNY